MLCSCQSLLAKTKLKSDLKNVQKSILLATKIIYIAEMRYNIIPVIMAMRIHLFPFRTQKLSSSTAKVLDHPRSGRIASCRISQKERAVK